MTMNGTMTRLDTTTLAKALVGFDRMFDTFETRFANQLTTNYPPHNIIKTGEYTYTVEMAVAGFKRSEISVEVEQEILTVKGEKSGDSSSHHQFLHRGLSSRNFNRSWHLAEHMVVKGAEIQDGVLSVKLEYILPEDKKSRVIDIVEVK